MARNGQARARQTRPRPAAPRLWNRARSTNSVFLVGFFSHWLSSQFLHLERRQSWRALVDQCSQSSFLSEALAKHLKLKNHQTSVLISAVGGQQVTAAYSRRVAFTIATHFKSSFKYDVDALVMPEVSTYSSPKSSVNSNLKHLVGLELADPEFFVDYPVKVLLCADVHAYIMSDKIIRGNPGDPIATATQLGWSVSGQSSTADDPASFNNGLSTHCTLFNLLSDLDSQIQKFWHQEEVPQAKQLSPDLKLGKNFLCILLSATGLHATYSNFR